MASFVKRAGKFMQALLSSVNEDGFTPVAAIETPEVVNEDTDNVTRTLKIMADMQYVEVTTDENGNQAVRLTPSGANILRVFNGEGR